jgi:hypothetical protein
MSRDALHIRPSEGPCEIHDWPAEGLATRLILEMRRKHNKGGVNVCRDCISRARSTLGSPPQVSLEILVTPDEWSEIRWRVDEGVACFVAVAQVLGEDVARRIAPGDVVAFRALPLGSEPPPLDARFAKAQERERNG